jgi:hypothetical protein
LKNNFIPVLLIVAGILQACHSQPENTRIKIERLEQSLFTIPVDSIAASVPRLQRRYGELFDMYNLQVIGRETPDSSGYADNLAGFLTDSYMNMAYRRVTEVYPDVAGLENGLSEAFSNYREQFPERAIPSIYTLTSGFRYSMISADTVLAISLDMYLGSQEEMYFRLNLASYQRHLMDKKYIVPDCMKAWAYTEFPYNDSIDNVLSNILYEGKIAYYTRQMLPETPDSIIFGYTPDQLRWCENNTEEMWVFLVEHKMLYETDYLTINKLTGPAPFCSLFTRESPGRAAVWLGYQIIRSYMKRNDVSLEELLLDNDYHNILAKARFKP